MSYRVNDYKGNEIKVGSTVMMNDEYPGVVTGITDPDADYDDDLQRGVNYPPKITVLFDDGTTEICSTSLANRIYSYMVDGGIEDVDETYEENGDLEVC